MWLPHVTYFFIGDNGCSIPYDDVLMWLPHSTYLSRGGGGCLIPYEDKLMWLHHSTSLSKEVADLWSLLNTRHKSWLYLFTSTNSTWVDTDDDDDDDDDNDNDDCKCGAASGLDGNSVVKLGMVNDIALLTLPYNSPLAWEHDKIWKCTVKPLGWDRIADALLLLFLQYP